MNSKIVDEIMEELSSTLERIETQSTAILEFIKEKGLAKDDDLAPYLERAATASGVRWRAARVRFAHLFAGLEKSERQAQEKAKEEKDLKEHKEAQKDRPAREADQKGGDAGVPGETEAAKAAEGSKSLSEQQNVNASNSQSADQRKETAPNQNQRDAA